MESLERAVREHFKAFVGRRHILNSQTSMGRSYDQGLLYQACDSLISLFQRLGLITGAAVVK